MITYELAKQLKDAGFPKKVEEYIVCDKCEHPCPPINNHGYPTLSELIEACKIDGFFQLTFMKSIQKWSVEFDSYNGEGSTPEEAVAKLWLELNKK